MTFRNRKDAADRLAWRLRSFACEHPLILGVPRGGVPVARIVADSLGTELDIVLVHKLRAPGQPELAIGAIDEFGHVYLADFAREDGISREYLEAEKHEQLDALRARRRLYTPVHPPLEAEGRTVIIVDDGIATGSTMVAAIRSVRLHKAAKVVVATPVAPPDTVEHLENLADEVICLAMPRPFYAIGQFYDDFSPVTDDEVKEALSAVPKAAVPVGVR